jgi:hypothetical protein
VNEHPVARCKWLIFKEADVHLAPNLRNLDDRQMRLVNGQFKNLSRNCQAHQSLLRPERVRALREPLRRSTPQLPR